MTTFDSAFNRIEKAALSVGQAKPSRATDPFDRIARAYAATEQGATPGSSAAEQEALAGAAKASEIDFLTPKWMPFPLAPGLIDAREVERGLRTQVAQAAQSVATPGLRSKFIESVVNPLLAVAYPYMKPYNDVIIPEMAKAASMAMEPADSGLTTADLPTELLAARGAAQGMAAGQAEGIRADVSRAVGQSIPQTAAVTATILTGGGAAPMMVSNIASQALIPFSAWTAGQLSYMDELDAVRAQEALEGRPLTQFDPDEMQRRGIASAVIETGTEVIGAGVAGKAIGRITSRATALRPAKAVVGALSERGAPIVDRLLAIRPGQRLRQAFARATDGTMRFNKGFFGQAAKIVAISAAEEGAEELGAAILESPFTFAPLGDDLKQGIYSAFIGGVAGGTGGGAAVTATVTRKALVNRADAFRPENDREIALRQQHTEAMRARTNWTEDLDETQQAEVAVALNSLNGMDPAQRGEYLRELADQRADIAAKVESLLALRQDLDAALAGAQSIEAEAALQAAQAERQAAEQLQQEAEAARATVRPRVQRPGRRAPTGAALEQQVTEAQTMAEQARAAEEAALARAVEVEVAPGVRVDPKQSAAEVRSMIEETDAELRMLVTDRLLADAKYGAVREKLSDMPMDFRQQEPAQVLSSLSASTGVSIAEAKAPKRGGRIQKELEALGMRVVWFKATGKRFGSPAFHSMESRGTVYLNVDADMSHVRARAYEEMFHDIQMFRPDVAQAYSEAVGVESSYAAGEKYARGRPESRAKGVMDTFARIQAAAAEAGVAGEQVELPAAVSRIGAARLEQEGQAGAFVEAAGRVTGAGPYRALMRVAARRGLLGREVAGAMAVIDTVARAAAVERVSGVKPVATLSPLARTLLWAEDMAMDIPAAVEQAVQPEQPTAEVAQAPAAGVSMARDFGLSERDKSTLLQIADIQRGVPESEMLGVQKAMRGGGILNTVVEHGGDVIERYARGLALYGDPDFLNEPTKKLKRILGYLDQPYGFSKEHEENIKANADLQQGEDARTVDDIRSDVSAALTAFGNAHRAIPSPILDADSAATEGQEFFSRTRTGVSRVLNLLNMANVAVGEQRWKDASSYFRSALRQIELQARSRQPAAPGISMARETQATGPIEAAKSLVEKAGREAIKDEQRFFRTVWPSLLGQTKRQLKLSPQNFRLAARRAIADLETFLRDNPKFADYYNKDWAVTRAILSDYLNRPITDDEFMLFRLFSGLNSPNTKLPSNQRDAVNMTLWWINNGNFDAFKLGPKPKTGTLIVTESPLKISGTTANIKLRSMKAIEELVARYGSVVAASNHLQEMVTQKELNAFKKEMGYKGIVANIGNIRSLVQQATGQDILIPRMFIFGQKVGAYTLNAIGDGRFTTVDIWESRHIRSYFEGMFEKNTGLPVTTSEHDVFTRFNEVFREEFEKETGQQWQPSALQAVRWFYIIDAAKRAGYTAASTNETISFYTERTLRTFYGYGRTAPTSGRQSLAPSGRGSTAGQGPSVSGGTAGGIKASPEISFAREEEADTTALREEVASLRAQADELRRQMRDVQNVTAAQRVNAMREVRVLERRIVTAERLAEQKTLQATRAKMRLELERQAAQEDVRAAEDVAAKMAVRLDEVQASVRSMRSELASLRRGERVEERLAQAEEESQRAIDFAYAIGRNEGLLAGEVRGQQVERRQVRRLTERLDVVQARLDKAIPALREARAQIKDDAKAAQRAIDFAYGMGLAKGRLQGVMEGRRQVLARMARREDALQNQLFNLRKTAEARAEAKESVQDAVRQIALDAARMLPERLRGPLATRIAQAKTLAQANRVAVEAVKVAANNEVAQSIDAIRTLRKRIGKRGMTYATRTAVERLLDDAESGLRTATGRRIRATVQTARGSAPALVNAVEVYAAVVDAAAKVEQAVLMYDMDRQRYLALRAQRIARYDALRQRLAQDMSGRPTLSDRERADQPPGLPLARAVSRANSDIYTLMLELEGTEMGVIGEMLMEAQAGKGEAALEHATILRGLQPALQAAGYESIDAYALRNGLLGQSSAQVRDVTLGGRTVSLPVGTIISIAAMDDETLALFPDATNDGQSITFRGAETTTLIRPSKAEIRALRSGLSAGERGLIDAMKNVLETQIRDRVMDAVFAVEGDQPPVVANYWPRVRLSKQKADASILNASAGTLVRGALTNVGFANARTGGTEPLVYDDAFKTWERHVQVALDMIHMAQPYRTAATVLTDPAVVEGMDRQMGQGTAERVLAIFSNGVGATARSNPTVIDKFTNNVTGAILAMRPKTLAKVLIGGQIRLASELPIGLLARGSARAARRLANPRAWDARVEEIHSLNGYFARRHQLHMRSIVSGSLSDADRVRVTTAFSAMIDGFRAAGQSIAAAQLTDALAGFRDASNGANMMIASVVDALRYMDEQIMLTAVEARLIEVEEEGIRTGQDALREAALRAERDFRRTQNASDEFDDVSFAAHARVKGQTGLRIFFPFSSDPLKARNQIRRAYLSGDRRLQTAGAIAGNAASSTIINAASIATVGYIASLIAGILGGTGPDDEEEKKFMEEAKRLPASVSAEVLSSTLGYAGIVLGQVVQGMQYRRPLFAPLVGRPIEQAGRELTSADPWYARMVTSLLAISQYAGFPMYGLYQFVREQFDGSTAAKEKAKAEPKTPAERLRERIERRRRELQNIGK